MSYPRHIQVLCGLLDDTSRLEVVVAAMGILRSSQHKQRRCTVYGNIEPITVISKRTTRRSRSSHGVPSSSRMRRVLAQCRDLPLDEHAVASVGATRGALVSTWYVVIVLLSISTRCICICCMFLTFINNVVVNVIC